MGDGDVYFDLVEDFGLIEASFAAQYGIRLRREADMSVAEFMVLLGGLLPDTPLGIVIGIRAEKDGKRIARFSKGEREVFRSWHAGRKAGKNGERREKTNEVAASGMTELQGMFERLFG